MVGIVWMVDMVYKFVGYSMFDITTYMVYMITIIDMEYFLCKVGMIYRCGNYISYIWYMWYI